MSKVHQLPLRIFGLDDIPAVPFQLRGLLSTLLRLSVRAEETKQAMHGLSNVYTIDGTTAPAYPFLFGESDEGSDSESIAERLSPREREGIDDFLRDRVEAIMDFLHIGDDDEPESARPKNRHDHAAQARKKLRDMIKGDAPGVLQFIENKLHDRGAQPIVDRPPTRMTGLSLEDPRQFAMSWTTFGNAYRDSLPHLETWAATLTDAEQANRQFWPTIADYGDQREGNVRGLPAMDGREALIRVLTSLIFRITAHGTSRLTHAANPGLSFVANFPPCLMRSSIPDPSADMSIGELLAALPNTGVIGGITTFLFTFVYSAPYEPFVPLDGVDDTLWLPGGPDDPPNRALIAYREAVIAVMEAWAGGSANVTQWPLNIET